MILLRVGYKRYFFVVRCLRLGSYSGGIRSSSGCNRLRLVTIEIRLKAFTFCRVNFLPLTLNSFLFSFSVEYFPIIAVIFHIFATPAA